MASEDTMIGNDFKVMLGDGGTPTEVFEDLCSAFDFGSIGEEKPLVDVTAYCDEGRKYRNGLADGTEIPLQCNFIPDDPLLKDLYDHYKNDTVPTFRIVEKDSITGTPPAETYDTYFEFAATVRAWNITGPIGEKSVLTYTLKVSGEVLWITPEVVTARDSEINPDTHRGRAVAIQRVRERRAA